MTITITGSNGEFFCNIVTDGEKCSVAWQDAERILTGIGKISIKGNVDTEDKINKRKSNTAQYAYDHAVSSECK